MHIDLLVNILFPPVCLACQKRISGGVICDDCFASINLRDSLVCDPKLPYILGAAGNYSDPVLQSLIHHLKFRSIKGAAEPLAELIARYVASVNFADIDLARCIVMPIPLSRRRFRARGYNQAELITRKFVAKLKEKEAGNIDLPIATDILIRAKHTPPQSETTSVAERKENIRGAFAITDSSTTREKVHNANILLIDDVCTTGSTFLEASLALKAAGAGAIVALAAAKT